MKTYPNIHQKRMAMMAVSSLVMLDGAATAVFVANLGLEAEANPFMRQIIENGGITSLFMVKLATIALYWLAMCWYKETKGHEYPLWPEIFLCVTMAPICAVGVFLAVIT